MSIFNIPLEKISNDNLLNEEDSLDKKINERINNKKSVYKAERIEGSNKFYASSLVLSASIKVSIEEGLGKETIVYLKNDVNNELLKESFEISEIGDRLKVSQIENVKNNELVIRYGKDFDKIRIGGSCRISLDTCKASVLDMQGSANLSIFEWESQKCIVNCAGSSQTAISEFIQKEKNGEITINSSGSAEIGLGDFQFDNIAFKSVGSSYIVLDKNYNFNSKKVVIKSSGSSELELQELAGDFIKIDSSGSSKVRFGAFNDVNVKASGSSTVKGSYLNKIDNFSSRGATTSIKKS